MQPLRFTSSRPLYILNLGAGVQSSALLIMILEGLIPDPHIEGSPLKLDACIFADTGDEPSAVYAWLWSLNERAAAAGIPIFTASAGVLSEDCLTSIQSGSNHFPSPPLRVSASASSPSKRPPKDHPTLFELGTALPKQAPDADARVTYSKLNRKCTVDYKILVIESIVKRLIGMKKGDAWPKRLQAVQLIGISHDEIDRMKSSSRSAIKFWHPLIELSPSFDKHVWRPKPLTRQDCIQFLQARGLQAPRSACWHCPLRSDHEWAIMKHHDPESFQKAVDFDRQLRLGKTGLVAGALTPAYLHRSLRPLDQVPLDLSDGQLSLSTVSDECEDAFCGV